ncbi:MAG: Sca4 family protein [Candidatus Rickettsia vulgarisii]
MPRSISDITTTRKPIPSTEEEIDPITKAIRELLARQRELIAEHLKEDIKDPKKFSEFAKDKENEEKINQALKVPELKKSLEEVEISGYKDIHTKFANRFSTMQWADGSELEKDNVSTRSQIVKSPDNKEIATLTESTRKVTPPDIIIDSKGNNVELKSYRTINFPLKLDNNDTMHLSLAVKDQNGKNIDKNKAVYFTAHYENGKLLEVSSPPPIKFNGNDPKAVGYIEQNGKIYTLPVTRKKYQEMMREVAINKGHGIDLSVEQKLTKSQTLEQGPKQHLEAKITAPPSPPKQEKIANLKPVNDRALPDKLPEELTGIPALMSEIRNFNKNSLNKTDKTLEQDNKLKSPQPQNQEQSKSKNEDVLVDLSDNS